MVKSIKVTLYPFDLLTSAGSRVILQLIKFVWIFTAVCYFSPHNDFKSHCVAFLRLRLFSSSLALTIPRLQ
jgi:hypothetical protein